MPAKAEKILVRSVNWLGDAVMTTPALQRLRAAKPQAHITLLTPEKLVDLWHGHPSIDAVIALRANESVWDVGRRLRAESFDTAVIFPNSPRSALEVFLARIPRRIGYARRWRNVFLTQAVAPRRSTVTMHKRSRAEIEQRIHAAAPREHYPPSAHHVHDYLQLVAALGADPNPLPTLLHVDSADLTAVKSRLLPTAAAPWFALNAGAEYGPAKRWPAERFVEAAAELQATTRCHWIIIGGRGDRDLAAGIARQLSALVDPASVTNFAGQTSLRELCAVLKACDILLTNDTGPMHVAAALGTPVIVPFGSTSPELTGPPSIGNRAHQILIGDASCAPCFLPECPVDFRCMRSITRARVVEAVLEAWRSRPPARG